MATTKVSRSLLIQVVLARVIMIATGAWAVYIGYTLLTTPLAIPVTVAIWLAAALTIALGARGKIAEGWGGFNAEHLSPPHPQE